MKPVKDLPPDVARKLRALAEFKRNANFQTWEMTVSISGGLHGGFDDWPAHIQDGIFKAIVMQCDPRPGHNVKIVASGCYQDVPFEPCYLRVVVQEFPDFRKVN